MERVLRRDRSGRAILWQCSECGKPFDLGWGWLCNRCIAEAERHREIVDALNRIAASSEARKEESTPER
jgi:hypothetical protein